MQSALDLAKKLIVRRSVTPDDAGCQPILAQRLAAAGFVCETIPCGSVMNLWARRGTGAPLLCFAGHTDVVPPGPLEQWRSDPFVPTIRDGKLYGRGAADMKSSIASFVVAAEAFALACPTHRGSIALLITSDEEGPSVDGTARVVERLQARGEAIDYCLVGEPTSVSTLGDTIKNGRRGSLSGRLTVRGLQGHIAYPHLARNPIHQMAPALAELTTIEWDRGTEHFPPTTWQVSNVHAGTGAPNIIPGFVELDFNFRFSTANSEETLRSRLESILQHHGLEHEIVWTAASPAYITERAELVSAVESAIQQCTNRTPALSTGGGTSDGRFIAAICPQVVELGPINASIHKIDEHIDLKALDQLPVIYLEILRRLVA